MISNVSSRWRTRLYAIVAAWAVLLVGAAFWASGATVREQVDAAEAREDMDAILGEAAAYLTGVHDLAAGPLEIGECEVTPVRSGLTLARTLLIERGDEATYEGLADRFGLVAASDPAARVWNGTTGEYLSLSLTESEPGLSHLRASTGCRPADRELGVVDPLPPDGGEASWDYGVVDCPGGGRLESWTSPAEDRLLTVHESSGGCV